MRKKLLKFSESPAGVQLHAGSFNKKPIFHSDDHKTYWNACMFKKLTPEELLSIANSIIADIYTNHPSLRTRR